MLSEFCSCRDKKCPLNPANHEKGCSLCVEKCIRAREIPSCFFNLVGDIDQAKGYTIEDFADFVYENKKNEN